MRERHHRPAVRPLCNAGMTRTPNGRHAHMRTPTIAAGRPVGGAVLAGNTPPAHPAGGLGAAPARVRGDFPGWSCDGSRCAHTHVRARCAGSGASHVRTGHLVGMSEGVHRGGVRGRATQDGKSRARYNMPSVKIIIIIVYCSIKSSGSRALAS